MAAKVSGRDLKKFAEFGRKIVGVGRNYRFVKTQSLGILSGNSAGVSVLSLAHIRANSFKIVFCVMRHQRQIRQSSKQASPGQTTLKYV